MGFLRIFKPTIWKIILTILLLPISYFLSLYIGIGCGFSDNEYPVCIYFFVPLLYFTILPSNIFTGLFNIRMNLVENSRQNALISAWLLQIIWVYILSCLIISAVNLLIEKDKQKREEVK